MCWLIAFVWLVAALGSAVAHSFDVRTLSIQTVFAVLMPLLAVTTCQPSPLLVACVPEWYGVVPLQQASTHVKSHSYFAAW